MPFSQGRLASYEGEIIDTLEAGVKFDYDRWEGYAAFFYTTLDDRRNVDFENDPNNQPAQFFVGRPILPRRVMVRLTYDF